MLRLRFHGRGGQGAKVASKVLGTAAFLEGRNVQDFPLYGAERRGAPIAAFTRISDEPIMERGVISDPDVVIVMDETLLQDPRAMPLAGLKSEGVVFVNTPLSPKEAKVLHEIEGRVITLNITNIGLDMLEKPILSALAGAVASRIVGIKEASLRKAVKKELSEIVGEKDLLEENVKASIRCFNAILPVDMGGAETVHKKSKVFVVPFEIAEFSSPAIRATANTPLRKTGNWRLFKPVWNLDVCTKCMTCLARCPEGCISLDEDGFPKVDYDNCKGCLICVEECPIKGIVAVREDHA